MIVVGPGGGPTAWLKWGIAVRRPVAGVRMCLLQAMSTYGPFKKWATDKFASRL